MHDDLRDVSRSHHAVLRGTALREVMTGEQIRTEVRRGTLERVFRDVYRLAGAPETNDQQLLAAVYAGGAGAVASHRSAAAMWEALAWWPDTPEISISADRRARLKGVICHRSLDLRDEFVTSIRNIPVTTPAFTLMDLGSVCGPRIVERALERMTIAGLTTVGEVEALHRRLRRSGRSGAGALTIVLGDLGLRSDDVDSVLEHAMGRLFRRFNIPPAVFHYVVHDERGIAIAEADFAYPDVKVLIEVDGFEAHGTPRALQIDLARQNALVLRGWTILRFTWNDVIRRPKFVADQILQILRTLTVA